MGKLGQLLVARGWITVQQLTRALQNQNAVGGRLGTCLLEMDVLGEDLLRRSLSEQLGVPVAGIEDLRGVPDEVLRIIPDKLARRCRAVPFRLAGGRLDVAMQDPRNLSAQDEVAFASGKRVKVHVLHEVRIVEALDKYYGEEAPSRYSLLLDRLNRARFLWEREQPAAPAAPAEQLLSPVDLDGMFNAPRGLAPPPLPEPAMPPSPRPAAFQAKAPADTQPDNPAEKPTAPAAERAAAQPERGAEMPPLAEVDLRIRSRRSRSVRRESAGPEAPPATPLAPPAAGPPAQTSRSSVPAAAAQDSASAAGAAVSPGPSTAEIPIQPPLPAGREAAPPEPPQITLVAPLSELSLEDTQAAGPPLPLPAPPAVQAAPPPSAQSREAAQAPAAQRRQAAERAEVPAAPPAAAAAEMRPPVAPPAPAAEPAAQPSAQAQPLAPATPHRLALTPEERADLGMLDGARHEDGGEQPPQVVREAPATFSELEAAFAATSDREEIGRLLLGFLAHVNRRVALFQATRSKVTGWMARGDGIDQEAFARFSVGFDRPSVFLNLRQGSGLYLGPLPPMPAHRELALVWGGGLPRDCIVLPVRLRERLVTVIYTDGPEGGLGAIDLQLLQRLVGATATAFERCILTRKHGGT